MSECKFKTYFADWPASLRSEVAEGEDVQRELETSVTEQSLTLKDAERHQQTLTSLRVTT